MDSREGEPLGGGLRGAPTFVGFASQISQLLVIRRPERAPVWVAEREKGRDSASCTERSPQQRRTFWGKGLSCPAWREAILDSSHHQPPGSVEAGKIQDSREGKSPGPEARYMWKVNQKVNK